MRREQRKTFQETRTRLEVEEKLFKAEVLLIFLRQGLVQSRLWRNVFVQ